MARRTEERMTPLDADSSVADLGRALAAMPGRPALWLRADAGCWWAMLADGDDAILHSGDTPAEAIAGAIARAVERPR